LSAEAREETRFARRFFARFSALSLAFISECDTWRTFRSAVVNVPYSSELLRLDFMGLSYRDFVVRPSLAIILRIKGGKSTLIRGSEAILLLRKWQSEQTLLRVTAAIHGFGFDFDCLIANASDDGWVKIIFERLRGSCDFLIPPEFKFEYTDPRNIPEHVRTTEGRLHGPTLVATGHSPQGKLQEMYSFSEIQIG